MVAIPSLRGYLSHYVEDSKLSALLHLHLPELAGKITLGLSFFPNASARPV